MGPAAAVAFLAGRAFVAEGFGGFEVIDLPPPAPPFMVGHYQESD